MSTLRTAILCVLSSAGCRAQEVVLHPPPPDPPAPPVHEGVESIDLGVSSTFQGGTHFGHFTRGRSCTVADFDLDGRQDIALGNPSDESYVLRNVSTGPGDVRFEVMTTLIDTDTEETSLAWVAQASDYDNDGDYDIFYGMGGIEGLEYNHLFRNELVPTGTLSFVDVAEQAGVLGPTDLDGQVHEGANAGAVWGDFDRDGDNDLFVSETVYPTRAYDKLKKTDWLGYNVLFRNNGDGTFTNIANEAKLHSQESSRHSSVADIDNDGDLDIYENNFAGFQVLWRNDLVEKGELLFHDITSSAALDGGDMAYPLESFVSATEDLNNDGWQDLIAFVRGYTTQGPYGLGHTIFLNVEGRGFVDATALTKLNSPFEPGLRNHAFNGVMGCTPSDMTGDGLVDFYIGNGGPESGQSDQLFVAKELVPHEFPGIGALDVPVYENWTDLIDWPAEEDPDTLALGIEYPPYPYRTHGICVADFDMDGSVEIAVRNGGTYLWGGEISREPNRLFRLSAPKPHGWLSVHPVGDGVHVSRDAIGTRLRAVVETPEGTIREVYKTLHGGNAFSASNGFDVYIGLGDALSVRTLEITWPDGEVDRQDNVPMNQRIAVER